ncbi:hypothetical protein VNO78_23796 [Psophocarpus tetragonolobus]|uniref:Uncharacterized protein n=1 Tax=Psophocarpus tetragonolobus TaxID=3891 RepID=A0AAN9XE48_PSOTE
MRRVRSRFEKMLDFRNKVKEEEDEDLDFSVDNGRMGALRAETVDEVHNLSLNEVINHKHWSLIGYEKVIAVEDPDLHIMGIQRES